MPALPPPFLFKKKKKFISLARLYHIITPSNKGAFKVNTFRREHWSPFPQTQMCYKWGGRQGGSKFAMSSTCQGPEEPVEAV